MAAADDSAKSRLPANPAGRLVITYLLKNKNGATANEILQHLKDDHKVESEQNLGSVVESILENGTALGFLERRGSHYVNWLARGMCGGMGRRRRRTRSCSRRRRRRIRRKRSCGCRRRRRRSRRRRPC